MSSRKVALDHKYLLCYRSGMMDRPPSGTTEYTRWWRNKNRRRYREWAAEYRKKNRLKIREYNTEYVRKMRARKKRNGK